MAIGSVGTKISVATTLPVTEDQAGYEALTWLKTGRVENFGEILGQWEFATANDLETGFLYKVKTVKDEGSNSMTVIYDSTDVGQVALEDSASDYSSKLPIKIELPNGQIYYSQILVLAYKPAPNSASDILRANCPVEFVAPTIKAV